MHRHLVDVLGQVGHRVADPADLPAGPGDPPLEVGPGDAAPELSERRLLRRVGDDDEVPVLRVARGRRLLGEGQALLQHLALDRPGEIEPFADGPRGREQLVGCQLEDHPLKPNRLPRDA